MVGMDTRRPTRNEFENCKHIILTSDERWDPSSDHLQHNNGGLDMEQSRIRVLQAYHMESDILLGSCSAIYEAKEFETRINSSVNIGKIGTGRRKEVVNAEELARKFKIGLETAKKTLLATTQNGLRSAVHPIVRRYKTDLVRGLEAKRTPGNWYTDTFFSK
eukprot:scaffold6696_cov78-Cylindrotheca_fusiformis.AAC.1